MNLAMILFLVGFAIWVICRIKSFRSFSNQDKRFFSLFWVWHLLYFSHQFLLKIWLCQPTLFKITYLCILLGIAVDGFYYYLLKAKSKPILMRQFFSALVWIPVILFWWGIQTPRLWKLHSFEPPFHLSLPQNEKAWVWTEGLLSPRAYYFMKPENMGKFAKQGSEDPNYGQAIFAPCNGTFIEFDSETLMLSMSIEGKGGKNHLRIGPIMPETLHLEPRQKIYAGQPLGLQGPSGKIPGIKISFGGFSSPLFKDYLSGYLFARQVNLGIPQRNKTVSPKEAQLKFSPAN